MLSFASPRYLLDIVTRQKSGHAAGIYSICSANTFVLEACMQAAGEEKQTLLIESTCNQVNPYGGYTGMTPAAFARYVAQMAEKMHYPLEKIILGGDHLGPYPWRSEPAGQAMQKACQMAADYVKAGYRKIHLDASMHCADDNESLPLSKRVSAERAAQMCVQAEQAVESSGAGAEHLPVYIIGTEVPVPGGQQNQPDNLEITTAEDIEDTLEIFEKTFNNYGLQSAWQRVIALVVQPGVEFGENNIIEYQREKASAISRLIEKKPGIIYEAHSTDYQCKEHLRQMVEDHFAILKVGPALTFAMREAVFALAHIEQEWLSGKAGLQLSGLRQALESAMQREEKHWKGYFKGSPHDIELARLYSYSDRIRYYWNTPEVEQSLMRLLCNLEQAVIPATLLSQFMPLQYRHMRAAHIDSQPRRLVWHHIQQVVGDYVYACGNG